MRRSLPYGEIKAEGEGEEQMLTFRLCREEALALSEVIRKADENTTFGVRGAQRLRGIAGRIVQLTRPVKEPKYSYPNYKVERPPNHYPSEIDREHVLRGSAPYPVLCQRDLGVTYQLLEEKGLSAPEIADRLYVDERTIYRWRKKKPQWMEQEQDDGTETAW